MVLLLQQLGRDRWPLLLEEGKQRQRRPRRMEKTRFTFIHFLRLCMYFILPSFYASKVRVAHLAPETPNPSNLGLCAVTYGAAPLA